MSTEAIVPPRDERKVEAAAEQTYGSRILSRLSNAFSRHRGKIFLLAMAATTAMTAYVLMRPNYYVAHAEILFDQNAIAVKGFDQRSSERPPNTPHDYLGSEAKLIGSALIVEQILNDINPEFDRGPFFNVRDRLMMLIGEKSDSEDHRLSSSRRLDDFRSQLLIEADSSTSVITISYRSPDPEIAARVANGLAQAFLEHRVESRQQAMQQEIRQLQRLTEASPALIEEKKAPLAGPLFIQGTSPVERRYARLSEELTNATLELANARARLTEAPLDALPVSPEEESARVAEKLRSEARTAEARFDELQTMVEDVEAELSDARNDHLNSHALAEDDTGFRRFYEAMIDRRNQISEFVATSSDTTRIIEPASIPSRPSMVSGAFLIGLTFFGVGALGFVGAILAELQRKGFNDVDEAESYLGLRVLGMLPNVHGVVPLSAKLQLSSREKRWALEGYTFIEGVRGIFNAILPPRGESSTQSHRVVAITSCFPDEGKTILALSLARQSAAGGAKVLLVEGDMRKVGLATKLTTVSPRNGLVDLLSGKVDWVDDVIVKETESGADLLLASGPSEDAFALSRSVQLKTLLGSLKARYDLIIVDCPPVLGVSDTLVLCDEADEVLFVVRWQETHRSAVRSAIRALAPRPIAGVVLTQVDLADRLRYATAGKYQYQDTF
ncbi:MAG: AAA family ATPase [Geminicoccales bacterium]